MKRVADTSRSALATVQLDKATREAQVIDGLVRYRRAHAHDPTAYELLRFLQVENATLDLNAVRPRLTELENHGRVTKREKRRCTVTEKRVYTWSVVSPSPVLVPYAEQVRPDEMARQLVLL